MYRSIQIVFKVQTSCLTKRWSVSSSDVLGFITHASISPQLAQSLSQVPTFKRCEVLIMQRMDYSKGLSAPFASELEAFDKIFDGNLTASNVEALDTFFPDGGKGSPK